MKNILKNKKGFTLLEVLVTVGIVGVLSAIAIPAYKQYKDNANRTAVKLEVSSGQKAYLAYDTANNSFCTSLAGAGVATIGTSAIYANASEGYAGFNNVGGGCSASNLENDNNSGTDLDPSSCELTHGSFKLGAGFIKTGSVAEGYFITDEDSGPTASNDGGSCADDGGGGCSTPPGNKDDCNAATDCEWTSPTNPKLKLCDV